MPFSGVTVDEIDSRFFAASAILHRVFTKCAMNAIWLLNAFETGPFGRSGTSPYVAASL
jgi:hypothetical protein